MADIKAYKEAKEMEQRRTEELLNNFAHLQATYIREAVASVLVKHKFPDKPYRIERENTSSNNEAIAVFEMKQRIKMLEKSGLPKSPD